MFCIPRIIKKNRKTGPRALFLVERTSTWIFFRSFLLTNLSIGLFKCCRLALLLGSQLGFDGDCHICTCERHKYNKKKSVTARSVRAHPHVRTAVEQKTPKQQHKTLTFITSVRTFGLKIYVCSLHCSEFVTAFYSQICYNFWKISGADHVRMCLYSISN